MTMQSNKWNLSLPGRATYQLKSGPRPGWQITYKMQDSAIFLEKSGSRFCLSSDKDASATFGDTLQKAALAAVAHKGSFHGGGDRNTLSTQMPSLQAQSGRTQDRLGHNGAPQPDVPQVGRASKKR